MEEHNQIEPEQCEPEKEPKFFIEPETTRDPQIELLRSIAHSLRAISDALYAQDQFLMPETVPNELFPHLSFGRRLTQFEVLLKAIERLRPAPWYVRLGSWFRLRRPNSQMAEIHKAQKEQAEKQAKHMQHLAENAGKLSYGRFRSRYL